MIPPVKLTRKQLVVAAMFVSGFSNGEICRQLGIRPYTVEWHVREVRDRFREAGYSYAETGTKIALSRILERGNSWTL